MMVFKLRDLLGWFVTYVLAFFAVILVIGGIAVYGVLIATGHYKEDGDDE